MEKVKEVMEKLESNGLPCVNGYIISVQSQGMPPVQSYEKEASEIGSIVSAVLKKHPNAIVLISASVLL